MNVRPFLMFQGSVAEEAMRFYLSVFPGAAIIDLERHEAPHAGVKLARFSIGDQVIMCSDSLVKHDFGFTPASSLFVTCETEDDVRRLAAALGEGGATLMPVASYGFSRLFAWVNDRFGVSWQLNLP